MHRKKGGFTLIEVLLALTLVTVVSLLMYSFFGQGLSLYTAETSSANEQMNLRQVLSDITNKTRLTDPEDVSYENGVLTVGDYVYAYDSARQQVTRNATTLATRITAFTVSISENMLHVGIVDTAGTEISTSLSLSQ